MSEWRDGMAVMRLMSKKHVAIKEEKRREGDEEEEGEREYARIKGSERNGFGSYWSKCYISGCGFFS